MMMYLGLSPLYACFCSSCVAKVSCGAVAGRRSIRPGHRKSSVRILPPLATAPNHSHERSTGEGAECAFEVSCSCALAPSCSLLMSRPPHRTRPSARRNRPLRPTSMRPGRSRAPLMRATPYEVTGDATYTPPKARSRSVSKKSACKHFARDRTRGAHTALHQGTPKALTGRCPTR